MRAVDMPSTAFKRPSLRLVGKLAPVDDSGIRSLPDLLEFNKLHNPDHLFCIQALSPNEGHGKCCQWVIHEAGSASAVKELAEKRQPIALFVESNVGLFTFILALLSLNIPCVLLSFRLSPAAVKSLLEKTLTKYIIVSSRGRAIVDAALPGDQLNGAANGTSHQERATILSPPHFATFLDDEPVINGSGVPNGVSEDHVKHSTNGEVDLEGFKTASSITVDENDRKAIVLHSSGTTGLPKPIFLTHRYPLGYASCHELPHGEVEGRLNLSTLPLYHGFGFLGPCLALTTGMPVCLPSSSQIPTGSSTISLISSLQPHSLMTVPSILEDVVAARDTAGFDALRTLDFVAVGGGPLKPAVGKALAAEGIKLLNHYGATEIGALATIFKPDETYDWRYLRLRADLGLELRSMEPENPNSLRCKVSGIQFGYPDRFEVQDELERNPKHPDREVKILGRADDLIVLATGEKFHPRPLEESLSNHPKLRRALAFGESQFEIGVIIEPAEAFLTEDEHVLIDSVWSTILEVNKTLDSHGKISSRSAVIVAKREKPLPTSDKGSPMRKECYALYAEEIDAVYKNLDDAQASQGSVKLTLDDLEEDVRAMVQYCLSERLLSKDWSNEDDFFSLGMDSLQATRFRRMLNAAVIQNRAEFGSVTVTQTFVHLHPSVSQVANALRNPGSSIPSYGDRSTQMLEMAEQYTSQISKSPPSSVSLQPNAKYDHQKTILLTGSTGNIGVELLKSLCQSSTVKAVICLVRSEQGGGVKESSARARQEKAHAERDIVLSSAEWAKVDFMQWKMGQKMLGLASEEYDRLVRSVTHVFHAAWPMDFERTLPSFKPQMQAMVDLIELIRAAHANLPGQKPRIVFASSIAAVGGQRSKTAGIRVAESIAEDPTVALPMGYGEAKWVCERIVQYASSSFDSEIEASIIRIGQVSGSKLTGFWSKQEHIPALLKLSKSEGLFPRLTGTASWLPVDTAARVIKDIILNDKPVELVYHVENPIRQPWLDITTIIRSKIGQESSESLIPLKQWIDRVAARDDMPQGLVTFFRSEFEWMANGSLVLDTQNSRRSSPTLRSVGGASKSLIESYVESCV
ncbi:MAG: hypothetical protein Q9160_005226 [Pyrenula sp. 1 TL-2023]